MDLTLIDSGAFIGWLSERDRNYDEATRIYDRLVVDRVPLVTTNLIVSETCTWLLWHAARRHADAVAFGDYLQRNSAATSVPEIRLSGPPRARIALVYSNAAIDRRAWEIFAKYDTARFSFTDCVSFAVMEALSIKQAFTFDEHYDAMGFERLPG